MQRKLLVQEHSNCDSGVVIFLLFSICLFSEILVTETIQKIKIGVTPIY